MTDEITTTTTTEIHPTSDGGVVETETVTTELPESEPMADGECQRCQCEDCREWEENVAHLLTVLLEEKKAPEESSEKEGTTVPVEGEHSEVKVTEEVAKEQKAEKEPEEKNEQPAGESEPKRESPKRKARTGWFF